jgi:hypothetical protein
LIYVLRVVNAFFNVLVCFGIISVFYTILKLLQNKLVVNRIFSFVNPGIFVLYYSLNPYCSFLKEDDLAMSDILPEGEDLRRAVKWISGRLQESPDGPVLSFVNEAVFKFDLSPKDGEFLIGFFRRRKEVE